MVTRFRGSPRIRRKGVTPRRARATGPARLLRKNQDQVRAEQDYAKQDGWAITYAVSTPRYASFSGVKAGRVSYTRMIPLCGDAFAEFDLAYSKADIQKFNPSIDQLVASLKPTDGSAACPRKQ